MQQSWHRQPAGRFGRGRSRCTHMLLGRVVVTRILLGRSLSPSSSSPTSRVSRRFRPFCRAVLGTASSAAAAETCWAKLACFLAGRSFSSSSSSNILRHFLLCGVARGLSADSGGVGSQSARHGLCGRRGRSVAATGFSGPTLASISLPPLSLLSSSLSLPSSEVAPSSSSCAFSSTLRFSLTSGGVCPMGHLSAAP